MVAEQRSKFELKVGLFVLMGVVVFVAIVFSITDYRIGGRGYYVSVVFDSAKGIGVGAEVQYAGVTQGEVKAIRLAPSVANDKSRVQLLIWLPNHLKVYADDRVIVSTFGLLGEKFLEIRPGPGRGTLVRNGGEMQGMESASAEDLFQQSSEVVASLQNIVGDEQTQTSLRNALRNLEVLGAEWTGLARRANRVLTDLETRQGTLGRLLYDDLLYEKMVELFDDLKAHPWRLMHKPKRAKAAR